MEGKKSVEMLHWSMSKTVRRVDRYLGWVQSNVFTLCVHFVSFRFALCVYSLHSLHSLVVDQMCGVSCLGGIG